MHPHLATRWRLAIGISVLAVLLAAPPALAGSIVPGVSIHGVRLGQSAGTGERCPRPAAPHGERAGGPRPLGLHGAQPPHGESRERQGDQRVRLDDPRAGQGARPHGGGDRPGVEDVRRGESVSRSLPGADPGRHPPVCLFQNYWTTRMLFRLRSRCHHLEGAGGDDLVGVDRRPHRARTSFAVSSSDHDQGLLSDEEYAAKKADVLPTM